PGPTAMPIPAAPQSIAAVVKPDTVSSSLFKMTPAPKNPTPETIWAANRRGSMRMSLKIASGSMYEDCTDTIVNKQLTIEITKIVFNPKDLRFNSRSRPIVSPKMAANNNLTNISTCKFWNKSITHLYSLLGVLITILYVYAHSLPL